MHLSNFIRLLSTMAYFIIGILMKLAYTIYCWLKSKYSLWAKRGIIGPKPWPFVGNFGAVFVQKKSLNQLVTDFYNEYQGEKCVGLYNGATPVLLVRDPELVKQILIKDFAHFQDRGVNFTGSQIEQNLFASEAESWRVLRHRLTPIFSTGKLKTMVPLIQKSMNGLLEYTDQIVENNADHEIRSLAAEYTLDVIGSCAFGVEVDAFSDKENVYREIAKKMLQVDRKANILQFIGVLFPGLLKKLGVKGSQEDIFGFFLNMVNQIVEERTGKPKVRRDFMDFMIELKEEGRVVRKSVEGAKGLEITNELMAAQAFIFYLGGFETSSGTMSFLLHEICQNQEVQDRLYNEISATIQKHGGVTYEAINDMHYLGMVFDETLRKYPILGTLIRRCGNAHSFPNFKLSLEKDTSVMIPVLALQNDPKYFPNPEIFDPERFSAENKAKLPSCVYLPFGDGPRNCIGMRFAKVQSLIGLAGFLNRFKVEPSINTKTRLEFEPKGIILMPKDGIWVNIKRR